MDSLFQNSKSSDELFVWAGPCSAESPQQLRTTIEGLVKQNIRTIRAGIWKPRTRPNSFEGIGYPALQWMQDLKKEFDINITTEVASAKHVEACLEANFDALWIGARTTVNPFLVQEIAESLKGVDIPVFIKNPIHSEIGLWIGAIERFQTVGVKRLGNIFRGFHTMHSAPYRNQPKWKLALEIKRLFPELPLICDPSHIAGKRNLLQGIAQTAIDLQFDGLMLESHCNPDVALSDAAQQVTPVDLDNLLNSLILKKSQFADPKSIQKIEEARLVIDQLDSEILRILEGRFQTIEEIGRWKQENNVSVFQLDRYQQILEKHLKNREDNDSLSSEFVKELFELIHKYSIAKQIKI
jgi:chorismate mutase